MPGQKKCASLNWNIPPKRRAQPPEDKRGFERVVLDNGVRLLLLPDDGEVAAVNAAGGFHADSAMSYVKQQVAFGPRVPGSPGWKRTGDWIVGKLKAAGAEGIIEYPLNKIVP